MAPIHILLVEDNEGDILLTLEALHEGNLPLEVSVVKDGWEALQFIAQEGSYIYAKDPDLILLDVNLPKVNGHEVLEKIKSADAKKDIPVIMLTTSSSESDISKSFKNRADSYIPKPVDAHDFKRVIDSVESFWVAYKSNSSGK